MTKHYPERAIFIGCAGWALPKAHLARFPETGTHLARYAQRLPAVEINSSFYRPHKPETYAKWAASVPDSFRFAVKVPKSATHGSRLVNVEEILDRFLQEVTQLGGKLGPLLVQLPPSLSFNVGVAERFFNALRHRFDGNVALEPRHASWFEAKADTLVTSFRIARVAADPALAEAAGTPGGWKGLVYYRLHGSPKTYYSAYSAEYLASVAQSLLEAASSAEVWCIFDNTAEGAATANALEVLSRLRRRWRTRLNEVIDVVEVVPGRQNSAGITLSGGHR